MGTNPWYTNPYEVQPLQRSTLTIEDDEDFIDLLIAIQLDEEQQRSIPRQPCRTSALTGRQWVEELLQGHHTRLFENCRMSVDTFRRFCQVLREGGYMIETPRQAVSIEEVVCMFLVMASHNARQRFMAERFQHSTETINRYIRQAIRGIALLGDVLIRPRNTNQTHPNILLNDKFYPWFKDCIGATDGTHVPAWAPAHRREAFRNRHSYIIQNVLAACDHDMHFVYICSGWEGSANDARVFLDAVTREGSTFPLPPQGKYYVVDSAYRSCPGFLAPYSGQRYHLQDFRGRGRGPRGAKELFNHRHSSIRNVIERAFGVLKKRFSVLRGPMPNYFITRQAMIVIACAAVHNFIRDDSPDDIYFTEHEDEDKIIDDDTGGSLEYDTSTSAVAEWNIFRDSLATNMWNASRNNN